MYVLREIPDQKVETNCASHNIDVGFVVDVSGSVADYWDEEKTVVKEMAKKIDISTSGGHAAVILFSSSDTEHDSAELKIKFSDYDSPAEFEGAVNSLPLWGGGTNIHAGLEVAYNDMFNVENGMRSSALKTLVLITDGTHNEGSIDFAQWGNDFRDSDIRIIAIGIGDSVRKSDLLALVNVESDFHFASNWTVLLSEAFINNITICNGMLCFM